MNVVVSGGAVSDIALHFLERAKMMVVKEGSKFNLRRICRATGARPLVRVVWWRSANSSILCWCFVGAIVLWEFLSRWIFQFILWSREHNRAPLRKKKLAIAQLWVFPKWDRRMCCDLNRMKIVIPVYLPLLSAEGKIYFSFLGLRTFGFTVFFAFSSSLLLLELLDFGLSLLTLSQQHW